MMKSVCVLLLFAANIRERRLGRRRLRSVAEANVGCAAAAIHPAKFTLSQESGFQSVCRQV
jgi:hypothetical protein